MNMYNLIEYSEKCAKTSGSLWSYYRDQPALDSNVNITDFPVNDDTSLQDSIGLDSSPEFSST